MRAFMRPPVRFGLLATAALLLAARTAAAQDGGVGSSFGPEDFFVGVQHDLGANLSDFDVARFFNKARCDCDETVYVYAALTNSGFAKRTTVDRTGNIEFWVGTDCSNISLREFRCKLLQGQTMQAFLNDGRTTIQTTARVLSTYTGGGVFDGGVTSGTGIFPPDGNPTCTLPLESFDQTIYVLSNKTGTPQQLDTRSVHIDLTPPPAPTLPDNAVQGGEQAVVVNWEGVDSSLITDMLGYQVLCNRAGELQVFSDGTFETGFQSCPATTSGMGVQGLDIRYICSPLLSATSRSFRIKILQNGIQYGVTVVAIDRSGNASTPVEILYADAKHTKSFYDVYRNDQPNPGLASGGFCTVADGRTSRGALTALAAAVAIGAVIIARRRRR
jgi:hypothetical protein